jgi:hypothetical protein
MFVPVVVIVSPLDADVLFSAVEQHLPFHGSAAMFCYICVPCLPSLMSPFRVGGCPLRTVGRSVASLVKPR